ncbi:MAG TPA: hypothetical protein VJX74_05730 [Blastocatellia bacterium]|nr:hypothetical protein [Blastocatellia bacterium]
MSLDNLQRLLLYVAMAIATFLLSRFAIDFTVEMNWLMAVGFWLLVIAALAVAISNIVAASEKKSRDSLPKSVQALFLAMIPLGFIASSLDCTGLSLSGCTPFCTFIKTVWVPAMAILCATYFFKEWNALLLVISAMAFVPLVPHCVCFNVGNGWWIERIGTSPVCYAWGFTVSVISVNALRRGKRVWASLIVSGAIIAGATAFFVSHHYFHFPW